MVQMAVAPGSIVKDFDVIENVGPGQIPSFMHSFPYTFLFQAAEKRKSRRYLWDDQQGGCTLSKRRWSSGYGLPPGCADKAFAREAAFSRCSLS